MSMRLLGAALATVLAGAAGADEPADLEDLTVLGRARNLVGEAISASEGTFGQPELANRPILRTGEVLELVPGLIVTQHSGTGKSNQMFLRGFNLDHGTDFATWIDGMPVNNPASAHGQGYTDVNFLIPELIAEVHYRKGGYYAEVGDFSSAGSADISTFRTLSRPLIKAGVGEDGFRRVLAGNTFHAGGAHVTGAFEAHVYDGPWTDISEDLERYNGLLRWSAGGEWGELDATLMGYEASWNSADQIPQRAVARGLIGPLGSLDDDVGGETGRWSLSARFRSAGADGNAFVFADAYAIRYDLDLWSNFTYFLDNPDTGDEFQQSEERLITGGQVGREWRGDVFGVETIHRAAVQLRHDNIDDVGLYHTAGRRILDTVREDDVTQYSAGAYYELISRWDSSFRSVLGLRYDYYHFDVDAELAANSGRASDSLLSPKASLVWTPGTDLELYLSAGGGFHSNDARGTTISVDPASGEPAASVDALVRSWGAETGARYTWSERLNSSLSLWWLELDSELLYVGDAGNTEASDASRRWGVELANWYRPLDWLTLDLDLSWTHSELVDSPAGDDIPGAIPRVASAGITVDSRTGLFGSLRWRYFGPRPLTEDGSVESGSFSAFNLLAGWQADKWRVELAVLNLLDSEDHDIDYYYASRLPGEPPEGVEDVHFHPIEPRTVRLSFSWGFGRGETAGGYGAY
ncbi:MAG: TonB-dependent receptor [Gammaproteobacteria bacterium]